MVKHGLLVAVVGAALAAPPAAGAAVGSGIQTFSAGPAHAWVRAAAMNQSGSYAAWSKLGATWAWHSGRITHYECHLGASWPRWSSWRPRLVASSETTSPTRASCGRTVEWTRTKDPRDKHCIQLGLVLAAGWERYSWQSSPGRCA
jgi:hypothetical protein